MQTSTIDTSLSKPELYAQIVRELESLIAGESDDIANLESSVRNHDPILALDGGNDGLDAYRTIITKIKKHLRLDGKGFFEVGIGQASYVARLAENTGFHDVRIHADLAGIPRAVEISMGKK